MAFRGQDIKGGQYRCGLESKLNESFCDQQISINHWDLSPTIHMLLSGYVAMQAELSNFNSLENSPIFISAQT